MTKENYIKIAKEYGEKSAQELANELGYTVAHIYNAINDLRKSGVVIERRQNKGNIELNDAVADLLDN